MIRNNTRREDFYEKKKNYIPGNADAGSHTADVVIHSGSC